MKVCIASVMTVVMVLISVPVPVFTQETFDFEEIEETFDCEESKKMGSDDASERPLAAGWFLIGVGTGVFLPLFGIPLAGVAASVSAPKPKSIPEQEKINESCYIEGYTKKARKKNENSAIIGGVVGTVVTFIIVYSVMNSLFSSFLESND